MRLEVEVDREDDARYIADVAALPGAIAYGQTEGDAVASVEALALRVIADIVEHHDAFSSVNCSPSRVA